MPKIFLAMADNICIMKTQEKKKERMKMKNLSHEEMIEMAVGFGYDGEPVEAVHDMCDIFKVSDDKRKQLVAAYEEGHFDW